MPSSRARLAALAIATVVAIVIGAAGVFAVPIRPVRNTLLVAWRYAFPDPAVRHMAIATERAERIRAELAGLREHSWAGVYRTAGSWPTTLSIAPASGFATYDSTTCGICSGYSGHGRVLASSNDRVDLQIEFSADARPQVLDSTLYFVRWGELVFAVRCSDVEAFRAATSSADAFPRAPYRYLGSSATFDPESPQRPQGAPRWPDELAIGDSKADDSSR